MGTSELNTGINPEMDYHPVQGGGGGVEILPCHFMLQNLG